MKIWMRAAAALAVVLLLGLLLGPWLARTYWTIKSSNPVRRGTQRARQLGCFSCHGDLGRAGLKDPGVDNLTVPGWSGGLYMMYVQNDDDIRRFIRDGSVPKVAAAESTPSSDDNQPARDPGARSRAALSMPPFRDVLRGRDLEDLTAAFHVLSGMVGPPTDSAAERGYHLAQTWGCASCHGPGGSGGLPNPGSFTGFIPGWYGPDFRDMVRSREEFDTWVREGRIPRLTANPVASYFIRRQRLQMPRYKGLLREQVDDLWTYVAWLGKTDGGIRSR